VLIDQLGTRHQHLVNEGLNLRECRTCRPDYVHESIMAC
jgi:hypothetical protein